MNKRMLIGTGAMLIGGILVVTGLLRIPVVPVVLILVGGALGFIGYRIFDSRRSMAYKPDDLNFG